MIDKLKEQNYIQFALLAFVIGLTLGKILSNFWILTFMMGAFTLTYLYLIIKYDK